MSNELLNFKGSCIKKEHLHSLVKMWRDYAEGGRKKKKVYKKEHLKRHWGLRKPWKRQRDVGGGGLKRTYAVNVFGEANPDTRQRQDETRQVEKWREENINKEKNNT